MQYGFYFDQSRCVGCNACTISCKDFNQINPGPVRWRTHRLEKQEITGGIGVFENLTMACNHCADPACMTACGAGAIRKDDRGLVIVDRNKCISLKSCITACPFATPKIALDKQEPEARAAWQISHPMQKCKACWERVYDGEMPVCVQACPMRALDFGEMDDLMRKYADAVRMNPTDFPYAYANNNNDTKPSFIIKKRKPFKVSEINKIDNNLL